MLAALSGRDLLLLPALSGLAVAAAAAAAAAPGACMDPSLDSCSAGTATPPFALDAAAPVAASTVLLPAGSSKFTPAALGPANAILLAVPAPKACCLLSMPPLKGVAATAPLPMLHGDSAELVLPVAALNALLLVLAAVAAAGDAAHVLSLLA